MSHERLPESRSVVSYTNTSAGTPFAGHALPPALIVWSSALFRPFMLTPKAGTPSRFFSAVCQCNDATSPSLGHS